MDFLLFPLSSLLLLALVTILACQHAGEQDLEERLRWALIEMRLDRLRDRMIEELCNKEKVTRCAEKMTTR